MTIDGEKVSVLMSCYNSQKTLKDSINSVLTQTYKNFEFLIIDDNSSDNTLKILQDFENIDERIKVYRNSKNIGLVSVKHEKRHSGTSTYSIKSLFSLWFDMIINYHFLPIRPGSFIGAIAKFFVLILKFSSINKSKQFDIKSKTF